MTSLESLPMLQSVLRKEAQTQNRSFLDKRPVTSLQILHGIQVANSPLEQQLEQEVLPAELAPRKEDNETLIELKTVLCGLKSITAELLEYIPSLGWSERLAENDVLKRFYSASKAFEECCQESHILLEELHLLAERYPNPYADIAWQQLRSFLGHMMAVHTQVKHDLRYTAGRQYRGTRFSEERDEALLPDISFVPIELEEKYSTHESMFRVDITDSGDSSRELLVMMNSRLHGFINNLIKTPLLQQQYAQKRKQDMPFPDVHDIPPLSHYLQTIPELQDLEMQMNEAALLGLDEISSITQNQREFYKNLFELCGRSMEEDLSYAEFFHTESTELRWNVALEMYKRLGDAFPIYLFNLRRFHKQKSLERIQGQITHLLDVWRRPDSLSLQGPLLQKYTKLMEFFTKVKHMPALVEPSYQLVHPRNMVSESVRMARENMRAWIHEASEGLDNLVDQMERVYARMATTKKDELVFPEEIEQILYDLQNLFFVASSEQGNILPRKEIIDK